LTSKWVEGSNFTQIIEILVTNTNLSNYATLADTINITASSDSFDLVVPGTISRLATNQSVVVQLGVRNKAGTAAGTSCSGTVVATWGGAYGPLQSSSTNVTGSCGFGNYTASASSLAAHSSPDWFNNAKYGIFIHWGLYSAPAYGSVAPNEDYAEWYWRRMSDPTWRTQTYQYHNETYGESFNYDDFMSNFTAANWDPKAWVDLVSAAGAQYIVPVTSIYWLFLFASFVADLNSQSTMMALRFSTFRLRSVCAPPCTMDPREILLGSF
jgi:alpha-L-fucosidase